MLYTPFFLFSPFFVHSCLVRILLCFIQCFFSCPSLEKKEPISRKKKNSCPSLENLDEIHPSGKKIPRIVTLRFWNFLFLGWISRKKGIRFGHDFWGCSIEMKQWHHMFYNIFINKIAAICIFLINQHV